MVIFMFFMKNKTEIYIYIGYKLGYDCISQKCLQLLQAQGVPENWLIILWESLIFEYKIQSLIFYVFICCHHVAIGLL